MCVAGVFLLKVGCFTRRHMHNFPPCLPLCDARCIHTRQNKKAQEGLRRLTPCRSLPPPPPKQKVHGGVLNRIFECSGFFVHIEACHRPIVCIYISSVRDLRKFPIPKTFLRGIIQVHKDELFSLSASFKALLSGCTIQPMISCNFAVELFPKLLQMVANVGPPGCTEVGMQVPYLFGAPGGHIRIFCPGAALHHNKGVLCIICTAAGSDTIKWFTSSSPDGDAQCLPVYTSSVLWLPNTKVFSNAH